MQITTDPQFVAEKQQAYALVRGGDLPQAKSVCESLCKQTPLDPDIWALLCEISFTLGAFGEAEEYGQKAVALAPDHPGYRYMLAVTLMNLGKLDEAIANFELVIESQPGHALAYFLMGNCYRMKPAGGIDRALACHLKAYQLLPDPPRELLTGLTALYEQSNEPENAAEIASRVLNTWPLDPIANVTMAKVERRRGDLESARNRLIRVRDAGLTSPTDRAVCNELGMVLDRLGTYEMAFNAFEQSQQYAAASAGNYKPGVMFDRIYRLKAVTTPENVAVWQRQVTHDGIPSPIFLVGFPRSGTTLVERIIASHPDVTSSDEVDILSEVIQKAGKLVKSHLGYPYSLNELIPEQLTVLRQEYWSVARQKCNVQPDNKQFLDKLPLNIIHLCLINRIFPDARIILLLRDPRDVCLSCFMQLFNANDAMANFYDLKSTARFYDVTMQLWHHYEQTLELNLLKLRYEDLVQDFERQTRKLINFLGVEWDDRVLKYHENVGRGMSTPSYMDISQPIYRRAMQRWRNYEVHIQPALDYLRPHIEAFGYKL